MRIRGPRFAPNTAYVPTRAPWTAGAGRVNCSMATVVILAMCQGVNLRRTLGAKASAPRWDDARDCGPLGRPMERLLQMRFRAKLAEELGRDSAAEPEFAAIVDLVNSLHARGGANQSATVDSARNVLRSLFPNWPPFNPEGTIGLLYWFKILFARPFPVFSARLNAWVTYLAAQWLMGRCRLEDLAPEDVARVADGDGLRQLVLVERCRYLEETGCASVCVNTCLRPTQQFFAKDMGVPMQMVPDFETLECEFRFGVEPTHADEEALLEGGCFDGCRQRSAVWHGALATGECPGVTEGSHAASQE